MTTAGPVPTDLFGHGQCPGCRLPYPVTLIDAEQMFVKSLGLASLDLSPDSEHVPPALLEHWAQMHAPSGDSLHFPTEAKLRADGYVSFREWRTSGSRPAAPTVEEIVRALADRESPVAADDSCGLCGSEIGLADHGSPALHHADCPWRQAKEWVALRKAPQYAPVARP